MDANAISLKYRIPLSVDLDRIFSRCLNVYPRREDVDNLMNDIIRAIKTHEKSIPVSQFKRNIKSYWCPELSLLKYNKVQAYREWCKGGRPRDRSNHLFQANNRAKKDFRKLLKQISRQYEDDKLRKAVESSELDHTAFWRLLKRERDGPRVKTPSIKNLDGKIVHEVQEILGVWKTHFSKLGTPVESDNFDEEHFKRVNEKITELLNSDDLDDFSREYFSFNEIYTGICKLNSGKAPGCDGVTKEHIINAGHSMCRIIGLLFNWILSTEYIPINFRRGTQIPLYKGKNSSTTDVNNYRRNTLLSVFNKLFEVVFWKRMEGWWVSSGVINQLQGACRKGVSCVHSAFILQKTIATLLENHSKIFVTYLDVSKAFNGVWIAGLFYR